MLIDFFHSQAISLGKRPIFFSITMRNEQAVTYRIEAHFSELSRVLTLMVNKINAMTLMIYVSCKS